MLFRMMLMLLATVSAIQGCVQMKTVNGAEEFEMVYFAQGDEAGKLLYQFSEIGKDVLPNRMLIDSGGRFFFLERALNRVQCFEPSGDFSYTANVTPESLARENESGPEPNLLDMFWFADGSLGVLVALGESSDGPPNLEIVKCDADGMVVSHYPLKSVPETLAAPDNIFCDELGFVWIFDDSWHVFDQYGNFNGLVAVSGNCVDAKGFCYGDAKPATVSDRSGKLVATLTADEEPMPDQVTCVSDKGVAVSWTRGLEETKSPTTLAYHNQINLFKIDRADWHFEAVATIEVPPTEYKYPHDQSDQAIPVQVYLPKSSIIRGDLLYVLAYSDETYWVSKLDISKLVR